MISAHEALMRLREGNRRFVEMVDPTPAMSEARRVALARGQQPFAIVLGCSDSRVPAELVFGQGFGDLFVIRVAGNIVAPSQSGSVELAASRFGTQLAVVLGHSGCGAVQAAIEELQRPAPDRSANLRAIVDRIRPSVEPLLGGPGAQHGDALVAQAVRANVNVAVDALQRGSPVLRDLIEHDRLLIVGAEYCLETGVVDFFNGV
jgi:carbonic anhydrase